MSTIETRMTQVERDLAQVQFDLALLITTVETAILWLGQSPKSPLSRREVDHLVTLLPLKR